MNLKPALNALLGFSLVILVCAVASTANAFPANLKPEVVSVSPVDGSVGVSVLASVTVNFNTPMNCNSLTPASFLLNAVNLVHIHAGRVDCLGTSATFTPLAALSSNTRYAIRFVGPIRAVNGKPFDVKFRTVFTTGTSATPDVIPTPMPTSTGSPAIGQTPTPAATATPAAPAVISSDPAVLGCNGQGLGTTRGVAVTFNQPMRPATLMAAGTFTITSPSGTPVAGSVSYDPVNHIAIFTPAANYPAGAHLTATVTTAARGASGSPMATDYVWTFTTGASPDTSAPIVTATNPVDSDVGIGTNQKIVLTFDKGIASTTLGASTFTLTGPGGTPVAGTVTYSTIGNSAAFAPLTPLADNTVYTGTITTGVTDLSGNPLASDFVWTFTTGDGPDTIAPTVSSTDPASDTSDVATDASVNATFDQPMDPATLTPATFTMTGPDATVVAGKVSYDAPDNIVTFTPLSPLAPDSQFTATISGALDLSGNALPATSWIFTTGATTTGVSSVNLGAAAAYELLATTTVSDSGPTVINGNLGLSPGASVTGFSPATVNGTMHINDVAAAAARAASIAAYNALTSLTSGETVSGDLGGATLTSGLYTIPSTLTVSWGDLTLDANGDPNAIWIFQIPSALDVAPGQQIILANGAQASNIFWQVGSSATIETNAVMQGNILAAGSITLDTGSTITGRALSLSGQITADATTASLPSCE